MKKTRTISLILAISILVSMLPMPAAYAADESKMYYKEGYSPEFYDESNKDVFESIKNELPAGTRPTITAKGNVLPFNYRLWFAKNIVVYGNHSMVPGNDFKAESDSPYGVGYYSKNGVRGEYRYHGFDAAGNPYSNTWWTIDTAPDPNINDNKWLYRPWAEPYNKITGIKPSHYNRAAENPNSQEAEKTRDWINRPIVKPDDVTGKPVVLTFENIEAQSGITPERLAYRIIHIMSPPTILYPGEGKAWHRGKNGQIYYRTFTLDKLDHADKLMTDVEATIKILTPENKLTVLDYGTQNTTEYLESEISVDVEVTGILRDEEYYNDPVKKVVRYTRDDIKDWTISLGNDNIKDNIKSVDYNKGKAVFTLKYQVKTILAKNTYPLKGSARVNFKNNASNNANASTNLVFKVEKVYTPIRPKQMTPVTAKLEPLAVPEELVIFDYGENNSQEYLSSIVTVPIRVTGMLMDEAFYNNPEEREKRYNRDDIHSWTMSVNDETYHGIQPNIYHKNRGEAIITLTFTRGDILNKKTWNLNGFAECLFIDRKISRGNATGTVTFTIQQAPPGENPQPEDPPGPPPEPPPPPVIVEPKCNVPEIGFDIVPFVATDETDVELVASREVYVNGEEVDDDEFFGGNYIFGDGNDGIKKIDIIYESIDGITSTATEWAYIYSTKPAAQFKLEGTFKQNRKLTATENCEEGNTGIVLERYPIVSYEWRLTSVDASSSSLKVKTPTSSKYREFLCKEPGVYRVELTVTNTLGRVSDPYILDFVVYEDTPPAIEMNIWNGVLTRGEQLSLHYSTSSVDNDTIAAKTLQLYYDSNNDGTCEQLVKTFANGDFTGYAPDKLGKYKLVATAAEEFGQDTIPEFVTSADRKAKTLESEFWVDNLVPMTDLYVNIPIVKPEIDLFIMLDKNLNDTSKQYIMSNRINFTNTLRAKNILPKVENWDMKTYEYSQTVSDTRYTGESYPPSTISYSSGGYSGILSRYNVVDNGEYKDFGRYETRTESKEFTRTHSNTITKEYWNDYGTWYLYRTTESNPEPSSCYINEDGYSGSIPRVSRNGPYNYREYDKYYADRTFERTHSNTVTDYYSVDYGFLVDSVNSSPAPSSYYINEDGYSGSIPRVGTNGPYNRTEGYTFYQGYYCWYVRQTFEAVYRGTLTKLKSYKTDETYISTYRGTLTKTVQVWVPDIRWVSDYIGYYSGTVHKYVRQPYTDPFRPTSYKYVVYVSDGTINELSDLQMVISRADAKLILVGNENIKSQASHDLYISKDKPANEIMQEIMDYIATNCPAVEKYYVLAGIDTFDVKTMNYDEEGDPIVEQKFQYVQNPNYFDNPTGMESFAAAEFSENGNWTDTMVNKFNKVGEFHIYRRIKDMPSTDPNFANYSYYSGIPELIVYAHRKPIAKATLDWDYDNSKGVYKTTWVDLSYDLDHQYSREDKGIVERKIMFRKTGGEWNYYIPAELSPGTYELQYYVKDVEGVWSDPFNLNFTLQSIPPVQLFDAKLRPKDPINFRLDAIPASEYLEVYDAWTRNPNNVRLEIRLYNSAGTQAAGDLKVVEYNSSIGTKTGNDIYWNPIDYRIPETTPDGNYKLRVIARDTVNNTTAQKEFDVTVNTPINLTPSMPGSVMTETTVSVGATTTKYPNVARVTLFYGTSYQKTLDLVGTLSSSIKNWTNKYTIPLNIPEGIYTARFTSSTPSGKIETKDVQFKVETLKITELTITGGWNHWRGQVDMFGKQLSNEPHRFLSLEEVTITVKTDGYAEEVEIRFSPELEAMQYQDAYGNIYDYKNDFGLDYVSFPVVITLDSTQKENTVKWKYVLPLAPDTKSWDDDETTRIKDPYKITVTVWKGTTSVSAEIDDIDVTGSIYDLIYMQPAN